MSSNKDDQIIARRRTADDKSVALWSDGSLTWGRLGTVIKGSPNAKTQDKIQEALAAGWLVMGEIELYDSDELTRLITAARKVASKNGTPGDLRREFTREPHLRPKWTVLESDRQGRPRLRVWRLPRLSHPGLAVWDDLSSRGPGRYHVMTEISRSGTFRPTGVRFGDLDALSEYLKQASVLQARAEDKHATKTKSQIASEIDDYLKQGQGR